MIRGVSYEYDVSREVNSLRQLLKGMIPEHRDTYFTLRMCCDSLRTNEECYYLPVEIWCEILRYISKPKECSIDFVDPETTLSWVNDYVTDKYQLHLNPVIFPKSIPMKISEHETSIHASCSRITKPISNTYLDTDESNDVRYINQVRLSRLSDIFIGFEKIEGVKFMRIEYNGCLTEWIDTSSINTYTMEYIEGAGTDPYYTEQNRLLNREFWFCKDIFPISLAHIIFTDIILHFKSSTPMTSIIFAYLMLPKGKYTLNNSFKYGRCNYQSAMITIDQVLT